LLSISSLVGGLAEAGVLVLIAQVAFALASDKSGVHVHIGPAQATVAITPLILVALCLVLLRLALNVWQARLSAGANAGVLNRTRATLVRLYLAASWPLQAGEREGRLQELLTTYAQMGADAIAVLAIGTVALFNLAALVAAAFVVNAVAALAVAVAAAAIGLMLRPFRALAQRRSRGAADANLAFATALTELAASTQEVRVFGVEGDVRRRLERLSDQQASRLFRTRFLRLLVPAVYQGTALLLVVAALGLAYAAGVSGLASLGAVVLIMLRSLTYGQTVQSSIQTLNESAPYFETLLDEQKRYRAAALPRGGDLVGGIREVAFERVTFQYVPDQLVLRDVSFRVHRGEIIGIIGPTGAGKSTLVQLLLRLREPTAGRILADGRDVRELALDDWYRRVTFVPQEARLFAGTVADNIRFFRDSIDGADVERAARQAHVHGDILSWTYGYQTQVGERGGELSGGQRQRLCIARALVEDPDVVVLDEPTSALDPQSEALMRDTMASLAGRATVLVIAHRLSTLSICDRIMVIHKGVIEGFDEPTLLEEANPFYREALRLSGMR